MVFLPDFLHPVPQRLPAFPLETGILCRVQQDSEVDIPVVVPKDRADTYPFHVTHVVPMVSCADDINFL